MRTFVCLNGFVLQVQEASPHRAAGELPGGDPQSIHEPEPRGLSLRPVHLGDPACLIEEAGPDPEGRSQSRVSTLQ